jgi:Ca2+-binding RTX toxin-like protein
VTVTEGNGGTVNAVFTVTRTNGELASSVDFQTSDGTATAPGDYTALPLTTLSFNVGEVVKTITVLVNGDVVFENNETFSVVLSNAVGATIGDDTGVGTILNDDAAPALSIDDVTVTEGNSGTTTAVFTVTKTGATEVNASVNAQTADDTATAPSDYTAAGPTAITFLPGETSKTFTVLVNGDDVYESILDETFFVNLSGAAGATIADAQGVGTIANDDALPVFSINDISVTEGNAGTTIATFAIAKTGATELTATVEVVTADGTALAGSDYQSLALTTVTFLPGETAKNVLVNVNGDIVYESNQTFFANLLNATNATIGDNQGAATIINDDAAPVFTIDDVSISEGDSGITVASLTLTKSGLTELDASVVVSKADGTATGGSDYQLVAPETVTLTPGQTTQTLVLNIIGDIVPENHETAFLNLSAPVNATIADNQGVVTILNDDGVLFSVNDVTQAEGNTGTTAFTFVVTMTGQTALTPTVTVSTSDGTATAPGEYTAVGPTVLSFAPGTTQQNFVVQVTGDTRFEPNETFFVNLSNPTNGLVLVGQGTGTINNDDAAPVLSINDVTVTEGNSGTVNAVFTVTKTGATEFNATVQAQTAEGTANQVSDFVPLALTTLTFLPTETSKQVSVTVSGDAVYEINENFFVNLTSPSNATVFDAQGIGTITNDDAAPTLSINDVTVTEGNSGTTTATFTVTKTGNTQVTVTVVAQTANGTTNPATAGTDYTAAGPTTLTFLAAEATKQFTVNINGDTTFEANETFFVNLTSPLEATITDAQGVGTITNDDSSNTPPVAVNDTATTPLHTPVTINVIANDTDDKGVIASTVTPSDPANGSVTVDTTTGVVTYTPDFGFSGTDTFTYTVQDLEGTISNAATVTVTVNRSDPNATLVQVLPDPNNPGETALVVIGNDSSSKITIGKAGDEIRVFSGHRVVGVFDPTGSIVVFAGGGDDTIRVAKGIDLPVFIHGGAGDDNIKGGAMAAVLIGGEGNDTLKGGKGRNILIGGAGSDVLKGGKVDDILIGGTTAHDSNPVALNSILDTWSLVGVPYSQRINTIVNGPYPLNLVTVFDDGALDVFVDSPGNDWYFYNNNDRMRIGPRLLEFSRLGSKFGTTVVPGTIVKLS